ncbi:MAG: AbrB/MazE/SpoVT family DNA-binding domain-containing protein [Moorella humiferrea]|nr:AbrB/MazE/SpoVT family DNA-binding domain-containing protein [Moorella humiferrea]
MPVVTISSKGQLIIPADIRKKYAIKQGDKFEVQVDEGKLVLVPLKEKPFVRLYGALKGETSLVRSLLAEHAGETEEENYKAGTVVPA